MLKINEESPIEQKIEPIHISILTEVSVRDKYIYSRLRSNFEKNLKKLAYNHCKHNQITQLQLTRLHSRIRSTNLEVFSIHPNSGKFIVALGEAIYHFTCPKMLLRPIFLYDGKCFNNLAVKKLQKDFIISNTTLFLTPFERFITESPGELPCTKEFSTKFELADGKWIAVDKNGMHDIPEPSKELTWLENENIYKNTIDNVIFDLGKGLYSFNDIKRYNKLITFSGRRSTTVGKLTQQIHPDVFQDPNFGQIKPKYMFKQFQWKNIFQMH